MVLFAGLLLFSVMAVRTISIDIFPNLNLPVIYVIQQYGGMTAKQMEGFFSTKMQDNFLYIDGVSNIESKNIQGSDADQIKLLRGDRYGGGCGGGRDPGQPVPGLFSAGFVAAGSGTFRRLSLPVGELVFSSKTRSLNEVFDMAAVLVRPLFGKVPGLSAPPPFGSNARSVIIKVDPLKLREYNLSPEAVVEALGRTMP
jgi:multidrug efflux pump subunit AcrB